MHPLGALHGMPSSNRWPPHDVTSGPGESESQNPTWNDLSTKKPIQVLSVGRIEPVSLVRETFVDMPDFAISIAIDYRELWIRSGRELSDCLTSQLTLFVWLEPGGSRPRSMAECKIPDHSFWGAYRSRSLR
jgi:hypothetical protein